MNNVVRDILKTFSEGKDDLADKYSPQTKQFMGLLDEIYKKNHLESKTKELISVAISVYIRCDYSIVYHTYKAFEAGAVSDEIMEAGLTAIVFGGESVMAYTITILKDSIEEFEKDFKKKQKK